MDQAPGSSSQKGGGQILKRPSLSLARDTITRWGQRHRCSELFGVLRHAERADIWDAVVHGGRWMESDDFLKWPFDPPLSDAGIEGAREMGKRVRDFATNCEARVHVIVSSPYYRCVQTAVEICRQLGGGVRIILDTSIGEVYGPCIMGDNEPAGVVRPMEQLLTYCRFNGVELLPKTIGRWPSWPENLRAGRLRFASRFLVYLRRSAVSHRNFLLVTHADGVASTLRVMPSHRKMIVSHVDFGGMFLAKRSCALAADIPSAPPSDSGALSNGGDAKHTRWLEKVSREDDCPGRPIPCAREGEAPGQIERTASLDDVRLQRWGWQVCTHQIHLQKVCTKTGAISYMKRILDRSSLSRQLIEQLLGDLSEDPVNASRDQRRIDCGSGHGRESMQRLESLGSMLSYSTYVFGSSNGDSQINAFYPASRVSAGVRRSFISISEVDREGSDVLSPVTSSRAPLPTKMWRMMSSEFGDSLSSGYISRLVTPNSESGNHSRLMSPPPVFVTEQSEDSGVVAIADYDSDLQTMRVTERGDAIVHGKLCASRGHTTARRHRRPSTPDPIGQAPCAAEVEASTSAARPRAFSNEASVAKTEAPLVADLVGSSLMQRRAALGMQRPGPLSGTISVTPEPPRPHTPPQPPWPAATEPMTPRL